MCGSPIQRSPELAAMGVPGQHEVRRSLRQMTEGSRIVEKADAKHAALAGMPRADLDEVRLPIAEPKIEPEDLDGARRGLDPAHPVDQQRDPRRGQPRAHVIRRFEVVVTETREGTALDFLERGEGANEKRMVGLRFHGQEVPGQEDEIRSCGHCALADAVQPPDGHERPKVRIGDLDDAQRARIATAGGVRARELGPPPLSDDDGDRLSSRQEGVREAQ